MKRKLGKPDITFKGDFEIDGVDYRYNVKLETARAYIGPIGEDGKVDIMTVVVFELDWLQLTGAEMQAEEEKLIVHAAVPGIMFGYLQGIKTGRAQVQSELQSFLNRSK